MCEQPCPVENTRLRQNNNPSENRHTRAFETLIAAQWQNICFWCRFSQTLSSYSTNYSSTKSHINVLQSEAATASISVAQGRTKINPFPRQRLLLHSTCVWTSCISNDRQPPLLSLAYFDEHTSREAGIGSRSSSSHGVSNACCSKWYTAIHSLTHTLTRTHRQQTLDV